MTHVLLQEDNEVAAAYQVTGTPSAVIVRPDGTIGSPLAAGAVAMRALFGRALGTPAPAGTPGSIAAPTPAAPNGNGNGAAPAAVAPTVPKIGEPAPDFRLPNLTGETVSLADFRGGKTLVLFWNPGCGFCQRMLPDLKAWEAAPPKGAPKLLVVLAGTVEANRAQGFRSTVVLDEGFSVGSAFGARGTPSAVLVDERGRIASDLAVGGTAVLELIGPGRIGQNGQVPSHGR